MIVKDKILKEKVDVAQKECPTYACYWPRPNPGSFQIGRGYKSYGDSRDKQWICGNRAIHGCPANPKVKL